MAKSVKEREREYQARMAGKQETSYVPEKMKIDVAFEACEEAGIPVEIKNNVLMTKCFSEKEYSEFKKFLSDLNNGHIPFSYGTVFLDKSKAQAEDNVLNLQSE